MKKTKLKTVTEAFPGASTASIEEWDMYLSSLEVPRREVLLNPDHYNRLAERETIKSTYENLEYQESQHDLSQRVEKAMAILTNREKQVIEMLYWGNFRKVKIAEKLFISRQAVQKMQDRALNKLKRALSEKDEDSLVVTILKGRAG